ncbi:ChaB family protein [Desulfobacca acetoxidans]
MRDTEVAYCASGVLAEVEELPDKARKLWMQAFHEALGKYFGDVEKAEAVAWRAFKGERKREKVSVGKMEGLINAGTEPIKRKN